MSSIAFEDTLKNQIKLLKQIKLFGKDLKVNKNKFDILLKWITILLNKFESLKKLTIRDKIFFYSKSTYVLN